MNAIPKLYLKEFLRAGLIFTIGFLLIDLLIEGFIAFSIGKTILSFIGMGLIWSLFTVSIHLEMLRGLGVHEFTDDVLGTKHARIVDTNLNSAELMELLKNDPFFGKMAIAEKDGEIELIRDIFWGANENVIKIKSLGSENGEYTYKIKSYPRWSWSQVDYGNSLESLVRFEKLVRGSKRISALQSE